MDTAAFSNAVLAGFIGGWEVILFLSIVLILFSAKRMPRRGSDDGVGLKQFSAGLMKRKEPGSVALDYAAGGEEQ